MKEGWRDRVVLVARGWGVLILCLVQRDEEQVRHVARRPHATLSRLAKEAPTLKTVCGDDFVQAIGGVRVQRNLALRIDRQGFASSPVSKDIEQFDQLQSKFR